MKRKAPASGGRLKDESHTTSGQPNATTAAGATKNKRRKLKDETSDVPSYYICWAQMNRFPFWPARVRFFPFLAALGIFVLGQTCAAVGKIDSTEPSARPCSHSVASKAFLSHFPLV
jgi:hypothetical protein